jgi:hypothetical protein
MVKFFSFLKAILSGLKQMTSNGYNACEVRIGKVTMSKPTYVVCSSVCIVK